VTEMRPGAEFHPTTAPSYHTAEYELRGTIQCRCHIK